jgi:co-chaperonin GroES (HSP10)
MIRPVGENVVVKPIAEDVSPGGIVIPQTAQEKRAYQKGKVVSVGKGMPSLMDGKRIPPEVEPGETVLYRFGEDIKDGEETLKLVREKDIIAVIDA